MKILKKKNFQKVNYIWFIIQKTFLKKLFNIVSYYNLVLSKYNKL